MVLLADFSWLPFLFAAGFGAAVFAFVKYRIALWEARRREEMSEIGNDRGLRFSEENELNIGPELKHFDLFDRMDFFKTARISNVLQASVGFTDVYLFDYSYMVSTGKSSKRVHQTVFFAKNREWALPDFKLKPEGWWQKIQQYFGKKDINFEEHPDFSKKWWLTGEFEALVRDSFSPEVRQFLEENPPMTVEGNNYYLIAYKPKRALDHAEGTLFYDKCLKLIELLQKKEQKAELLNLAEIKLPVEELRN